MAINGGIKTKGYATVVSDTTRQKFVWSDKTNQDIIH